MIDIIFAIILIIAIIKGYQKGLIIALFSIIALIVGLAAALKLSAAVAMYLQDHTTAASKWLPFISFAVVFCIVVIFVNLVGKFIEKTFEIAFLGWANRIGGILFYAVLYTIIFSICLFYFEKMNVFDKATINASQTYSFIAPLGPKVIDGLGKLIPLFKDTFTQLGGFFDGMANKIQQ